MIRRMLVAALLMCTLCDLAQAQGPPLGGAHGGRPGMDRRMDRREERREIADEMKKEFFPPEAVMKYQTQIEQTSAQRNLITGAISEAQSRILDLQWQMQSETQKLVELARATHVEEAAALGQLDKVLGLERDVKRQHVTMLIRIKNTLTAEQQSKLRSLRDEP
jgi:Spy/CpxP family protein refolding chaperone